MEDVILRRKGESEKSIKLGNVPVHLLAKGEMLEGMIVELPPGEGIPKVYSHEGEEIRIVLEGEIEVEVSGKKYRLTEGDSLWFKSKLPHVIRNPSKKRAAYFSANVPPSLTW